KHSASPPPTAAVPRGPTGPRHTSGTQRTAKPVASATLVGCGPNLAPTKTTTASASASNTSRCATNLAETTRHTVNYKGPYPSELGAASPHRSASADPHRS